MSRDDAVAALSSDREGCAGYVPDGYLQHAFFNVMIDRQHDIDLRNIDISHDTGGSDLQLLIILFFLFFQPYNNLRLLMIIAKFQMVTVPLCQD